MSGMIRTMVGMCVAAVFAIVVRRRFAMMMPAIPNAVFSFVAKRVFRRFVEETEPATRAGLDLTPLSRVHVDVTSAHICVIHVS
jgi:hypothetical protein